MRDSKVDLRVFLCAGYVEFRSPEPGPKASDSQEMEWMERIRALDQEISLLRYRNSGVSPCDL